mgnify:CR=1 FL=1
MIPTFPQLPPHWRIARLDRLATVNVRIGWKALTAAEYQTEGYAFLATPNIKSYEIDFENVNYISRFRYEESPELQLSVGDVLLAKDGNTLGITNVVRKLPRPATVNGSIAVIRPHRIESRFLRYVLASSPIQAQISAVKGGMGVPHLFQADIKLFPIPVPPPEEQRRIADFLDAETARIESLRSSLTRLRSLLHERRAAQIHSLVTGQDRPNHRTSGLPWVRTIPAHWTTSKITFVARLGSGHTPSRSRPEWWVNCTIPWITTGEVEQIRDDRLEVLHETREKISHLGLINSAAVLHPAGTVVLSRTASAGFSAVMGTSMATSQDFVTWTCTPRLNPFYLLWCLRAMRTDLLNRLAIGSTHKTIYMPDLYSLRIPLPPVSEQREIVRRIRRANSTLDRLLDNIDRQLDLLIERRHALITAAVTGQVNPTTTHSEI